MKNQLHKFIKPGLLLGLLSNGCIDLAVILNSDSKLLVGASAIALVCWGYWVHYVLTEGR